MKKINFILKLFLVIAVLGLSFYLRYDRYDKVPFPGESMDEYSYSWVGMSLIRMGMPVGISGIDGYKNSISRYINVDNVFQNTAGGNPQTINWPWFDHPPLLGLITGGFALSRGAGNFSEANIYIIRKPMLVLGTLSVLLIIIFGWINFGYVTGLVAGLLYGTMPIVVIGSRMIQGENGVIPMYLASMVLISIYAKNKKKGWLIAAGIMAGIACLFKLSGVAAIIGISIWLWNGRGKKDVFEFGLVSLSVASLFVLYGMSLDFGQFIKIFLSNSNRFYGIGSEAIYRLLTQVKVTNMKYLTDPMVLMGWVAFFGLLSRQSKNEGERLLKQMGVVWLLVYLFLGSYSHGWYAFPFYPILTLSLARIWGKAWKNGKYAIGVVLLWLMGLGYMITKMIDIETFQKYVNWWKLLLVVTIVARRRKLVLLLLLILLVAANMYYLNMLTTDYWYKVL